LKSKFIISRNLYVSFLLNKIGINNHIYETHAIERGFRGYLQWLRLLTIARIDTYLNIIITKWGFINFPGISYHESYASK